MRCLVQLTGTHGTVDVHLRTTLGGQCKADACMRITRISRYMEAEAYGSVLIGRGVVDLLGSLRTSASGRPGRHWTGRTLTDTMNQETFAGQLRKLSAGIVGTWRSPVSNSDLIWPVLPSEYLTQIFRSDG